ncbi:MAG TPA: PDZ domain-containing protein [Desulfobulbus sp.]|nr:PDZ domain-containing protein [Desulfobulbus sp.]
MIIIAANSSLSAISHLDPKEPMTIRSLLSSFSLRQPAILSLLIFFLSAFISTITVSAQAAADNHAETDNIARHTIGLSFDLKHVLVIGTSNIELPPNRSLHLDCGPLTVTGVVLEQKDHTPVQIRPEKNAKKNVFVIGARPDSQVLRLSWTLHATNPSTSGNLIGKDGITLAGFWHPIAGQDMRFELSARLPRGFTAVSEGNRIAGSEGTRLYRALVSYPLQSVHFVAGSYSVHSRKLGKVTISSYFFPEDQNLAPAYLKKAAGYIKRYEKMIGPFPYPEYKIVENRLPTGYGMPGFTLLGQAVLRLPFIKDTSLGHEILHSWFGNSIGLAESSGNWCEGLTTYLADQSFAADRGEGTQYRRNQILRYMAYVHPDNPMALKDFAGAGDDQPMARKIRAIGYDKGSMVFHMLEKEIGSRNFIRGLKQLYHEKKFKRASWQDIKQIFSRVSGKDLSSFFDQWLQRTDIPQLRIKRISVARKDGTTVTRFHLVQNNKTPYNVQVPVVITTLSGKKQKILTCNQLDQEFSISTNTLPTELVIDPDYDLMRGLDNDEIPPTLSRFFGADKKTIVLPDNAREAAVYHPLADLLGQMGVASIKTGELHNADLPQGSFLFAGDSGLRKSLFGKRKSGSKRGKGVFSLLVRKNPLNIEQTMVLVDSDSLDETTAAARKLSHYGKYGRLTFHNGKITQKSVAQTDNGLIYDLLKPPAGMSVRAMENFSAIMDSTSKSRVIYVGETHTSYGDHMLQLQVLQAMYAKNNNMAVGMEMFPRSSQQALRDYISGNITTEREFLKKSRYFSVWGFDYQLYRGIIGFCRKHKIPIIGLNLDKKIVSKVFRTGNTDGISPEEQKQMAAIRDLDVPGYRKRLTDIYRQHAASPHGGGNNNKKFSGFLQAQAIWDETMAESIADYLSANPTSQMIIIAGAGHVYKDSGIPLRVERRMPGIRQSVLVSDNGRDTGIEQGRKIDYLLFTEPMQLEPAAKIGVMLEEKKGEKDTEDRVVIVGISPHGFGKKAGLKEGDFVLAIDGTPVHDIADLKISLLDKHPGETVTLKIFRKRDLLPDETLEIPVELTGMPMNMMMPPGHPRK